MSAISFERPVQAEQGPLLDVSGPVNDAASWFSGRFLGDPAKLASANPGGLANSAVEAGGGWALDKLFGDGVGAGVMGGVMADTYGIDEGTELQERLAAGGASALWSAAVPAPLRYADALTGGNGKGLVKAGAEGLVMATQLMDGDLVGPSRFTDAMQNGKYGGVARDAARTGDMLGGGVYDLLHDDEDTTFGDTVQNMVLNSKMRMAASDRRRNAASQAYLAGVPSLMAAHAAAAQAMGHYAD